MDSRYLLTTKDWSNQRMGSQLQQGKSLHEDSTRLGEEGGSKRNSLLTIYTSKCFNLFYSCIFILFNIKISNILWNANLKSEFFIYQISWAFVNVFAVLMGISNGGNNALEYRYSFHCWYRKSGKLFQKLSVYYA